MGKIRELHLFAGIGGGIYGGYLLGHECCGGVEIDEFCQKVLKRKMADRWFKEFPLYGDITKLDGYGFKGTFDVLCGGFPCQAFSSAAHGLNKAEKNLWGEMFRFVQQSEAPVVFGENVTFVAIDKARKDLESVGYKVHVCKLSCEQLGGDHQRMRFWLLAVKDYNVFEKVAENIAGLPKLSNNCWHFPYLGYTVPVKEDRKARLKAIGNAQSPIVAATAFVVLVNRHNSQNTPDIAVSQEELDNVFITKKSWIKTEFGDDFGLVHTPTTMANYSCPYMMRHKCCRNFVKVFDKPTPENAEYLMGFPPAASLASPSSDVWLFNWRNRIYSSRKNHD